MLKFYIAMEGKCIADKDYIIVNKCHLIFPYKRTSASALQYVEYLLDYRSKFHGELGFINIFPNPNFKKRWEFVKIKNKTFVMLDEGNVYV